MTRAALITLGLLLAVLGLTVAAAVWVCGIRFQQEQDHVTFK